jgi:hypothetical protein
MNRKENAFIFLDFALNLRRLHTGLKAEIGASKHKAKDNKREMGAPQDPG